MAIRKNHHRVFTRASQVLSEADALLIGAGAGMGVDSGLPDFRGSQGFWRAYPPLKKRGIHFAQMANPAWFDRDPELAWGFYGHRLRLYRATRPHRGFAILKAWAARMQHGAFVFTSNVDGQFTRAGFMAQRVVECHGSIHHLQCCRPCHDQIWSASGTEIDVDEDQLVARAPLPSCPRCGGLARPNILMFGDGGWLHSRSAEQEQRLQAWLGQVERLVVVELGAGGAVPTVRWTCEQVAAQLGAILIRINPREPEGPAGCLSMAMGALDALRRIEQELDARKARARPEKFRDP